MLTVEKLKAWGAKADEGLGRCMNNEAFYLTLVGKALEDPGFRKLQESVAAGDLDGAFEAAHALKGVTLNLALTPISEVVERITELLRSRTEMDYGPLVKEIEEEREKLVVIQNS